MRTYTQKLVKDTDGMIKDLVNNNDDRHLKIQKDRLVDEFTAALTAFQAVQKKTVDIEKNQYRQARSNNFNLAKPPKSQANKNASFFDDFSPPPSNKTSQGTMQMQSQMQEEIDLQALEEQERTIRELEDNINGVNEIYKNLGALVFEQGNVIDSIESSVEHTTVFVSEGTEQLRKASHYQNQLRKKKLCIAAVLTAIVLVFGLVIYYS